MAKLNEILENKRKEVDDLKELHGDVIFSGDYPVRSFYDALKQERNLSIIAEIKRKSPSQGNMAMAENPLEIAKLYDEAGVNAMSILTDEKFFGGSFEFLKDISQATETPLLCKDFIIDRIQIDLAKLNGASAVLLIADILDDKNLKDLYDYAADRRMDVLLEAHKPENVKRAADLNARIIGINNRNLFTFEEDLNHSLRVRELIPDSALKVSLSSCKTRDDARKLMKAGYDAVLIGGVIMKAFNRKAALKSFVGIPKE